MLLNLLDVAGSHRFGMELDFVSLEKAGSWYNGGQWRKSCYFQAMLSEPELRAHDLPTPPLPRLGAAPAIRSPIFKPREEICLAKEPAVPHRAGPVNDWTGTGTKTMANEGIMILLTPQEIPRSHSRPEAATGCAGSYGDPGTLHVFMDTDTRNGHDICVEEQKSQPELRRNCLGRRKIKGKRFIDLRDSSDQRHSPSTGPDTRYLPYEAIRNWIRENIPADVFQKVFGTVGSGAPDLDAVVVGLLVKDLDLAREILVDSENLLPKRPVDGLLRTISRPKYPRGKKIINEAVIVNPQTVRPL